MRFVKLIFLPVLALALMAYAFDCGTTPLADAMQCCNSMPCSSHGHHGQDCCKTMPAMRAPFVQPSPAHEVSFASVLLEAPPAFLDSPDSDSSARAVAARSHAPPIPHDPAPAPLPV